MRILPPLNSVNIVHTYIVALGAIQSVVNYVKYTLLRLLAHTYVADLDLFKW